MLPYGLFRALHSHIYTPLRSVLNMCCWHIAPCPIFAYREAYAPLLCLRSASVGAKRTSTGCSAPYRGGSLSHKAAPVRAHRSFWLISLVSLCFLPLILQMLRLFLHWTLHGRSAIYSLQSSAYLPGILLKVQVALYWFLPEG